ncbi:MAG TPA: kelch repeat-containing protein [Candidatus Bathyarchaeia archaeon]|jgi:N-acetylneuraminic acid mutarotase|nr:kelch repeat-containing protein [Candidatus Bathyarchaeia archaeon]
MAQQALHAGTTQTRGRALFGLLDGNGWGWASLKAVFWFILMIFMLGYIPDRAYYFTVNKTIDLGILAFSPVNFCPPGNLSLPCPAPVGAVVPWSPSPPELSLPQPRTDGSVVQSGTTLLYVGGSDGKAATDTTFVAKTSGVGNFDKWSTDGPKLPAPRTNASVVYSGGRIFVVGGLDASGKPTDTVYVLSPDSKTGSLGNWQTAADAKLDLQLPEPRAGAVLLNATDGLMLVGGTNGTASLDSVLKATYDKTGKLGKWVVEPGKLYTPVTDASAALIGSYLWVFGGTTSDGKPTATVQRGEFGTGADANTVERFGVKGGGTDLPAPRTNLDGFAANGNLYAVGGSDGSSPQGTLYWAVPTNSGDLTEWKHLDVSDLPASGSAGGAPFTIGPDAIIVGGTTKDGVIAASVRANIAPEAPFFQLGLVGATVPALKIDGEIGQQLGYLNANTVGIVDFVIFLIIGWAFAHREQIKAWRERRRRERALRARA